MTDITDETLRTWAKLAGFSVHPRKGCIQAGGMLPEEIDEQLRRFAELARQDEREACAQLCEAERRLGIDDERAYYGDLMAEAIRARGGDK